MSRRPKFVLCILASSFAAASPASAATLEVPGDFSKIQDAVDAADPGDVIEVLKKQSNENVSVSTNRLKIKGVGRDRIVNAALGGGGYAFDITGNGVSVSNLTLRHGDGIRCQADRCNIAKVRIDGIVSSECVNLTGDNAQVTDSRFVGCELQGVDLIGNDARVTGNTVEGTGDTCMAATSDGSLIANNVLRGCEDGEALSFTGTSSQITGNTARNTDDVVIQATGDNLHVAANNVRGAAYACLDVAGAGNLVELNRASNCNEGIEVSGANPIVLENRVTDTFGDDGAFDIDCATACGDGRVEGNLARDTGNDEPGFEINVSAGTGAFRILDNVADRNAEHGFELTVPNGIVRGNLATRNGFEDESGFELIGDGMTFQGNTAVGNFGDGIEVEGGTGVELSDNVSRANFEDGFQIGGFSTEVTHNTATANLGDGIENTGSDTQLRRNTAGGNVVDCANSPPGTIAVNQKNRCADGSDFAVPGKID